MPVSVPFPVGRKLYFPIFFFQTFAQSSTVHSIATVANGKYDGVKRALPCKLLPDWTGWPGMLPDRFRTPSRTTPMCVNPKEQEPTRRMQLAGRISLGTVARKGKVTFCGIVTLIFKISDSEKYTFRCSCFLVLCVSLHSKHVNSHKLW